MTSQEANSHPSTVVMYSFPLESLRVCFTPPAYNFQRKFDFKRSNVLPGNDEDIATPFTVIMSVPHS